MQDAQEIRKKIYPADGRGRLRSRLDLRQDRRCDAERGRIPVALVYRFCDLLLWSMQLLLVHGDLPGGDRYRYLGKQPAGRLGVRHYQFRLVDRYRPRRNSDLRHPFAAQSKMAHLDQPLCRGDDAFRRGLRGDVPAAAHRASVAALTGCSLTRTRWVSGRSSAAR